VYPLISGSSIHAGLEADNLGILDDKSPLSSDDLHALTINEYDERMKSAEEEADFDIEEGRDRLSKESKGPLEGYADKIRPVLIEQGITSAEKEIVTEVGGKPFIGYTDLETERLVIDYKFLGRRKSKAQVDLDPQLVMYERETGKTGAFIQLLRKKTAETVIPERAEEVTEKIGEWCSQSVKNIEKAKKVGLFPSVEPTNWVCGNCSFRRKCLGF